METVYANIGNDWWKTNFHYLAPTRKPTQKTLEKLIMRSEEIKRDDQSILVTTYSPAEQPLIPSTFYEVLQAVRAILGSERQPDFTIAAGTLQKHIERAREKHAIYLRLRDTKFVADGVSRSVKIDYQGDPMRMINPAWDHDEWEKFNPNEVLSVYVGEGVYTHLVIVRGSHTVVMAAFVDKN